MSGRRRPNGTKSSLYGIERFFKPVFLLKPVLSHFVRCIEQFDSFRSSTRRIPKRLHCANSVATAILCERSSQSERFPPTTEARPTAFEDVRFQREGAGRTEV